MQSSFAGFCFICLLIGWLVGGLWGDQKLSFSFSLCSNPGLVKLKTNKALQVWEEGKPLQHPFSVNARALVK